MNKNEQDMINRLKEKTGEVQVPDGLKPENVEKLLAKKGKKKKLSPYRIGAVAAACLVVVAGVAVYQGVGMREGNGIQSANGDVKISDSKKVAMASDYEDVYAYMDDYKKEMEKQANEAKTLEFKEESVMDMAAAGAGAKTSGRSADAGSYAGDYSQTNVRQEGVDEGDVVKTDGRYLYVLKDNSDELSVVDTSDGEMTEVGHIELEESDTISEFYLDVDRQQLVTLCRRYTDPGEFGKTRAYWGYESTIAVTYDISDPANPKEVGNVSQSGSYHSSRISDGYLYMFSYYYIDAYAITRDTPETYIPLVNDNLIKETNIYLPSTSCANMYAVVTAISLDAPDETADSKALMADYGELYVSNENIYFYQNIWNGMNQNTTAIQRIAYKDGQLEAGAQGKVKGYINDSFSIDEYDGYLRVVTTESSTNSVYVLDQKLEEVGSIKGLAKDERIYSARLMGDIGYFVTFRETDPLFTVDLSDPKNPEIIGSLKIPGFSEYLHPYGEGKLLGIGMDVDEETMVTDGVKLTMFDISDPTDVKEEDTYVLENVYYTDLFYDYKSVLADADRNFIGFSGDSEGGRRYFVFTYDKNNGFICEMNEEINGSGMQRTRGVYIDKTLYVVQGNIIEAYSMKDYAKVDDIIL